MNFDPNSGFMYAIVAIVVAFVIAQSVFFLVKSLRRARELNMDPKMLKKVITSSAIFTIAPAVAILLGVITLSKALGFPLPWLRLSVVGALTYELPAAEAAASAFGITLSNQITDPEIFAAIAWVMTIGIIPGLIEIPLMCKGIQRGVTKIKLKDKRWGDIFMSALFLGMISAFLGRIFADVTTGLTGWIPVFVMLSGAVIMLLCGLIRNKTGAKWIEDYALPISMLGAMALALPITGHVNSIAA